MRLLLDQGLPHSAASRLRDRGIDAAHTSEHGLASASDAEILQWARERNLAVVTLDADFHAILALSGAVVPSVVRIRIEGLDASGIESLVVSVLALCADEIERGAAVTVTERAIRLRNLPILSERES